MTDALSLTSARSDAQARGHQLNSSAVSIPRTLSGGRRGAVQMTAIGVLLSFGFGSPSALAGPASERAVAEPISLTPPSEIPNPVWPTIFLTAGIDHGQPTLALAGSCPRGSMKHDWGTSVTAPAESSAICIRLAATTDAVRATPIPGPYNAILPDEAITLSRDAPTHKLVGIGGGATVPDPAAIVLQLADGYSWSSAGSRLHAYHYAVDLHLIVPQLPSEFAKRQPLAPATQQISADSLVAAVGQMVPSPDNGAPPVTPFSTPPTIEPSALSPAVESIGEQTRRSSANIDQTRPQLIGWRLQGAFPGSAWVIPPDGEKLGPVEITEGQTDPGLGKIERIFKLNDRCDRCDRGGRWIVQTSKGWIAGGAQ